MHDSASPPKSTRVVIVGGGPSGLLLSRKLHRSGIGCVVLERRSRAYVLSRIRAGVLEQGSVDQLRDACVSERLDRQGMEHDGVLMADDRGHFRIDFKSLTGNCVTVYGQTEITLDLYQALDADGVQVVHEALDVELHEIESDAPTVSFRLDGVQRAIKCQYVAGCDGFHGICRNKIPSEIRKEFERTYPFGWLGVLSESPPVNEELIYSRSSRGFALASMRSTTLSRYYVQVPLTDKPDDWSANEFWAELRRRLPDEFSRQLTTGKVVEKSIAPIRSFVSEPMSHGRLFLCGDAAHIVPPTGAKGLNLAFSDVYYLHNALVDAIRDGNGQKLDSYSRDALARVWKAMRFSWWMTTLLHRQPQAGDFDRRIQDAEFAHLSNLHSARAVLAENYVGLPY